MYEWDVAPDANLQPVQPQLRLQSGEVFGDYRIDGSLGQGGMGQVYLASDPAGRQVALKVLKREALANSGQRERFQREGELAARLSHPGIVGVHRSGAIGGVAFLACELVPGARELDQALDGLSERERVGVFRQVLAAVAHAHEHGVVHRDLKPQNILVDEAGRARVADFGLATAHDLERMTQTGVMVGTPLHMPPEQLAGGSDDDSRAATVDVWALGTILFEVLTGRSPFTATTIAELVFQISSGKLPAPSSVSGVSSTFDSVCARALKRQPKNRYPDAGAMLAALDAALDGTLHSRRRRQRVLLALLVGTALTSVLAAGAKLHARAKENEAALARSQVAERVAAAAESPRSLLELSDGLSELAEAAEVSGLDDAARSDLADLLSLAAFARGERPASLGVGRYRKLVLAVEEVEALGAVSDETLATLQSTPARFPEVALWRAGALLARGGLDRRGALGALRATQAQPERWRVLRTRLLVASGDLAEASSLLGPESPPLAHEVCAVALLEQLTSTQNPAALNEARARLPKVTDLSPQAVRRERREALGAAFAALATKAIEESIAAELDTHGTKAKRAGIRELVLALLPLPHALGTNATPDIDVASRCAAGMLVRNTPDPAMVRALSDACPGEPRVQVELAHLARGVGSPVPERCRVALPIIERAWSCATGVQRQGIGYQRALALAALDRLPEALASLDEILPELEGEPRVSALMKRSEILSLMGRDEEALAGLEGLLASKRAMPTALLYDHAQLLERMGRPGAPEQMARYLLRTPIPGTHVQEITNAVSVAWRERAQHAEALTHALSAFCRMLGKAKHPSAAAGWPYRLALLHAEAKRFDEAVQVVRGVPQEGRSMGQAMHARALAALLEGEVGPLAELVSKADARGVGLVAGPRSTPGGTESER